MVRLHSPLCALRTTGSARTVQPATAPVPCLPIASPLHLPLARSCSVRRSSARRRSPRAARYMAKAMKHRAAASGFVAGCRARVLAHPESLCGLAWGGFRGAHVGGDKREDRCRATVASAAICAAWVDHSMATNAHKSSLSAKRELVNGNVNAAEARSDDDMIVTYSRRTPV
jgi:hypothetical protein